MKFRSAALVASALCLQGVNAQILNIPEVDAVVSSVLSSFSAYVTHALHEATATAERVAATPTATGAVHARSQADAADPPYWLADIPHQGIAAFNPKRNTYKVFRNVKDYGAIGDGVHDDTAAINAAIADGSFLPSSRQTTTTAPAIVYFPAGTYLISSPIVDAYFTQLIGNPNALPVIKASASFPATWLIDGDQYQAGGAQGWGSTNVFFRQIRNLVLDMTAIPPQVAATGIHWPTAQATSLQNVQIRMSSAAGTQHQGLFIENGSGGFMADVTTTGGKYGFNVGNQQFTMRNIHISDATIGVFQLWSWGFTYQGLTITNCSTAFSMTDGGSSNQLVGSINIIDSSIEDCPIFVDTAWVNSTSGSGSLFLENIQLNNVPIAVHDNGVTALAGGTTTIGAWGQGHEYTPSGPTIFQGPLTPASRSGSLLAGGSSNYYTKSKPQYETLPVSSFVSVRSAGARGDGVTDDTVAIQAALLSAAALGKVVFFDQGTYRVTNTLFFPAGSRVTGESYPVIMASGPRFANIHEAVPVVQIGRPGDRGSIEWSDMLVSTQGSTPGAKLIVWSLDASEGSGMWDVHTRIGGFDGSQLQVAQCPISAPVSASCEAALMSMHITMHARNVYLENVWLWTADHDIDDPANTQISVYTGRGLLIEGQNAWLYGTAVEHHSLYQYQLSHARDIVAGFIQTETPYYQPQPDAAHSPYPINHALYDPDYSKICGPKSLTSTGNGNCDALALRLVDSTNISIYGAGLYSFFNHYSTTCSNYPSPENCQSEIFSIEGSTSDLLVSALSTVGTTNMIVKDGKSLALYADNLAGFPDTIAYFRL